MKETLLGGQKLVLPPIMKERDEMKKLPWTDEEIRTSYRDSGKTNTQIEIIAELNGCSKNVICKIVGKDTSGHWNTKGEKKKVSDDSYKKLIARYHEQGMTDLQIGRAIGKCSDYVGKRRDELGLEKHLQNEINPTIDNEALMKLYKEGKQDPTIAKEIGIQQHRVRDWRKRNGLVANKKIRVVEKESKNED